MSHIASSILDRITVVHVTCLGLVALECRMLLANLRSGGSAYRARFLVPIPILVAGLLYNPLTSGGGHIAMLVLLGVVAGTLFFITAFDHGEGWRF